MFDAFLEMLRLIADELGHQMWLDWYLDGGPKDHSEFFIKNPVMVVSEKGWFREH